MSNHERKYPTVDKNSYPTSDTDNLLNKKIIDDFNELNNSYLILNNYSETGIENEFLTFKKWNNLLNNFKCQGPIPRLMSDPPPRNYQDNLIPISSFSSTIPRQSNFGNDIIFLSHYYKEIPETFDANLFKKQFSFYMKNSSKSLAYLKGFSFTTINGCYFPIAMTFRPANGPLKSILSNPAENSTDDSYDERTFANPANKPEITAEGKFSIIIEIVNGVAFIHKSNFIHSNLNPTTVYLNKKQKPIICDYFLYPNFKVSDQLDDQNQLKFSIDPDTALELFGDTPYVAPEILRGGPFGPSADIYSLGKMMYFILRGEKPSKTENEDFICNDSIPDKWKFIIESCTKNDPSERPTLEVLLDLLVKDNFELISTMTPESPTVKISSNTMNTINTIKLNFKTNSNSTKKSDSLNIFQRMIPNPNELSDQTVEVILLAENGDPSSIEKVADFLSTGQNNFYQDLEYALECYKRAAVLGRISSLLKVAQFYEEGKGTDIDLDEAISKYEDALKREDLSNEDRLIVQEKIEKLNKKRKILILTNFPIKNDKGIRSTFDKINIVSINFPSQQKVEIEFASLDDVQKAKKKLKDKKFKKYKFMVDSLSHVTVKTSRFNSLERNLPRFDLDQITINKELGFGGFAKAYVVNKKGEEKPFAAKIFEKPLEDFYINSFKREIIMASKLKHPAILRYVGFSEYSLKNKRSSLEIKPTLFMEFIPNGNLEDAIKNKPVDWWTDTRKLKILIGIASGLSVMHENKIIHRDLKPLNILLNDKFEPVICDLGSSRQFSEENNVAITKNVGTSTFMAPEMFKDNISSNYGEQADSYAFGIIVYMILKLVNSEDVYKFYKPEGGKNELYHIMNKKIDNIIPPLDGISKPMQDLIKDCWNSILDERRKLSEVFQFFEDSVDNNIPLLPNINFDEVEDYINRLNADQ